MHMPRALAVFHPLNLHVAIFAWQIGKVFYSFFKAIENNFFVVHLQPYFLFSKKQTHNFFVLNCQICKGNGCWKQHPCWRDSKSWMMHPQSRNEIDKISWCWGVLAYTAMNQSFLFLMEVSARTRAVKWVSTKCWYWICIIIHMEGWICNIIVKNA